MKFYEALQHVIDQGKRMSRNAWKGSFITRIDPLSSDPVGDKYEQYVFVGSQRISGPWRSKEEASAWIAEKTDAVRKSEERYQRYLDLKKVRADTPLDYAAPPEYSTEYLSRAEIVESVAQGHKRLIHPFLAKLEKSGFAIYIPTTEDIFADDWKVA